MLADMDHVYNDCKHGLVENLRFLHGLMLYLRTGGYRVFGLGKAYDDNLYTWIEGGGRNLEYQRLRAVVFKAPKTAEEFEKWSYGLRLVEDEIIR